MNTVDHSLAAHPALRAYAQAQGIAPQDFRSGARLALTFDERHTVQVRPASLGRLALQADLLDLQDMPAGASEQVLARMSQQALALFRSQAPSLAIDEKRQQLCLQQVLPAQVQPEELAQALLDFVAALEPWEAFAQREAGLVPG